MSLNDYTFKSDIQALYNFFSTCYYRHDQMDKT